MAVNQHNKIRIPEDVKEFAKTDLKKFKKDEGYYGSKKELKEAWAYYLIDRLPETVDFLVRFGYIKDEKVQKIKNECYANLIDENFIKYLKKDIKTNGAKKIKLLPILIKEILETTNKVNSERLAQDSNASLYDVSDVANLTLSICPKKFKKFEKAELNEKLAYDVITVIPHKDALKKSQNYRIRLFFDTLYEHAKTIEVPYGKIMEIIIPEEFYSVFILFSLLERKEKFAKLTESQQKLYLDINDWDLKIMENLSKEEIKTIIKKYIDIRRNDDKNGRDSARRFNLSSLPADDYPKIATIVQMFASEESAEKYI